MYRKSIQSGVIIGLLLVLAMAYPVISEAGQTVPGWTEPNILWIPQDILRSFTLAASGFLLLLVGTVAVMRVRPARLPDGIKVGAVSGVVAAMIVISCLLSPRVIVLQGVEVFNYIGQHPELILADLQAGLPQDAGLLSLATHAYRSSVNTAFLTLLAGAALGAFEGLVFMLLRRFGGHPVAVEPRPALLDVVREGLVPRPPDVESPLRAGLWGGAIVGIFLSLEIWMLTTQGLVPELMDAAAHPDQLSTGLIGWLSTLAIPLAVLIPVAFIFWGGSGVLLLKHPPTRFGSRTRASFVAGTTAGAFFVTLTALPGINAGLVLTPLFASNQRGALVASTDLHIMVRSLLAYPLLPLFIISFLAVLGVCLGLPFVLLSASLWPRRPVDRASSLAGRIRRQPESLLPQLYALFQNDCEAEEVLAEVVRQFRRKKDQPATLVFAAYHTICQQPERTDTLKTIVEILATAPDWRWHTEIGELYRFLEEGRQVRNIHHLAAIQPLPTEQTSSLPAVLRQAGEYLSLIVGEVKKAQQLDDPNGRTIFFNRALEEIAAADRLVTEKMTGGRAHGRATLLPEQKVLSTLLDQWELILHESMRDLRGRAILKIELQTKRATYLPRLSLQFRVANEGLNVAEQVRVALEPAPGYGLTTGSEARLDLLPPGEQKMVELALEPRSPRPMRVLLHVFYNDAVEENRELTLADEVVFVETERAFQRIFPIPYVTGTPLKTREMFFGRQDVFDYVREHLLGAYQNNIIVLHGQRRTGKTSVLYQLPEVLQDTHYCVLLDMQGVAARSEAELFYALSDEIVYALDRGGITAELPPREEYDAQPEFSFRNRFLRGLYPALGEKHLLLVFDEFEELQHHVEEGHIGVGVFSFLRNLMQHEAKVDFIFSGTHKLEELAAEYWSILFNIATYKQISFLERSEVERLVAEPVAPFGMEYDPLAVAHIYEVTAGHPFLTQLVCHEMVAYHNETERSYITVTDVDVVLERIAERGEAHFKYVWAEADSTQRAVMLALAELLSHSDGATAEEVAALSERRGRPLDGERTVRALVRLESRDIVARTAPGSERLRFRVDLVRRYIVRNPQLADTVGLAPGDTGKSALPDAQR